MTSEPEKAAPQTSVTPNSSKQEVPQTKDTINNPVDTSSLKITRKVDSAVIKTPVIDSAKTTISPGIFTSEELKAYNSRCSYFSKNQKKQVLFLLLIRYC